EVRSEERRRLLGRPDEQLPLFRDGRWRRRNERHLKGSLSASLPVVHGGNCDPAEERWTGFALHTGIDQESPRRGAAQVRAMYKTPPPCFSPPGRAPPRGPCSRNCPGGVSTTSAELRPVGGGRPARANQRGVMVARFSSAQWGYGGGRRRRG